MSIKYEVTKTLRKYGKKIEIEECIGCGKIRLEADSLNFGSSEIKNKWIDYKLPNGTGKKDTYCCGCLKEHAQNFSSTEDLINDLEEKGVESVYVDDMKIPLPSLKFYPSFKF